MTAQLVTQMPEQYRPEDHEVWAALHAQQSPLVRTSATAGYLDALATLELPDDHVPDLDVVNAVMADLGQWQFVGVNGLLDSASFFELLARRRFPVTVTMRGPDELDFAELPDLFHDLFGHGPYLADPRTAALYHQFGRLGTARADEPAFLDHLQRLLWATLEVGLVQRGERRLAFGGAILSSASEMRRALDAGAHVRPLQATTVLDDPIDSFHLQGSYYVLDGPDEIATMLDVAESWAPLLPADGR
jgi:phenylalanine-4-hydroxylase